MHKGQKFFYVEAQTGIIRNDPPAISNFYQYCVPVARRDEVQRAVDAATLDGGQLIYPPRFLESLSHWDNVSRRERG